MERETITVKIETEENLEYDIHHEDKLKEAVVYGYVRTADRSWGVQCALWQVIEKCMVVRKKSYCELVGLEKTYNHSELDLHINSEECIKEEVHDSQQPECLPELIILPSIKEELPKHQVLSLLGQYGTSQTIFKGVILDSVENKINKVTHEEDKFYKYPKGGGKSLRHIVTCVEKICDEKGCSIQVRMGGECWKHGEAEAKNTNKEEGFSNQVDGGGKYYFYGNTKAKKKTCKEEECSKWAVGGGKCIKHGGTQVKNTCKVEGCFKQAQMVEPVKKKGALNSLGEEVNVGIMEEPRLRKPVKKTGALNGLWVEVNVLNMEAPGLRISVKKKDALNGLEGEGEMSYLTDTAQDLGVMKQERSEDNKERNCTSIRLGGAGNILSEEGAISMRLALSCTIVGGVKVGAGGEMRTKEKLQAPQREEESVRSTMTGGAWGTGAGGVRRTEAGKVRCTGAGGVRSTLTGGVWSTGDGGVRIS
uniref:Uncharacterized protein n=1 Tax=Timema genevievae TaxID=629358 RepID=A0A7R9JYI3_TIMGE|nr:unnamed protein product [Timema genevievae]